VCRYSAGNKTENFSGNSLDNRDFPGFRVTAAGLNIHYKCLGQGPPVVLVHGGGNDWHEWKKNLAFLAESFQVYALDFPGFGLSQPPDIPVSPYWCVEFLKGFLDSLGLRSVHLIGHSMGAMISLAFAARYPQYARKLIVIDAGGIGKISLFGRVLVSILRTLDRWLGRKRGPRYIDRPLEEWLVLDRLPEIRAPVLIVWGGWDYYLPVSQAQTAQALIPGSRLFIFPHRGHAPQRGDAAGFNRLAGRFLSSEE
jgi:pimeloyl-ACP methyl ester carboxylesterase